MKTAICQFALLFFFVCTASVVPVFAQQNCQPPAQAAATRQNIFSEEQEMHLGDAIAEHIQRSFRIIDDEALTANLRRIGDRIFRHLPPNKVRFQLFIVELPDANAFTLPGGRIYVSRKLIAFVQSEDELAGVIAHETGHVIARQGGADMTRLMRDVLKIAQVGDRQDIFAKYNQLVDNAGRNPKAFGRLDNHEDSDQIQADLIGLYAMTGAGYDPQSFSRFFDRLAETKGKTGGFFSDLFGVTSPDQKRLREMMKSVSSLPASCIEKRANVSSDEFKTWQNLVVTYSGAGKKEALAAVISKTALAPALRGEVTHLRFSPDGRHILAQDDSGISVLTREPFAVKFRIPAPEANHAQFTPDSQHLVFYNADLRVETWSIAEQKLKEVHEIVMRRRCAQSKLSPDGKTLACLDGDYHLLLIEVATGTQFFQKKNFYQPSSLDMLVRLLNAIVNADDDSDDFDFDEIGMSFSPDGRYFAAGQRFLMINAVSIGTENAAVAYDLQAKAPVQLKTPIKKLIAGGFAFLGSDRILGVNVEDSKKSGIVSFPNGDMIEQFPVPATKFEAATKGNYLLARPLKPYAVAVMDLAKKEFFKGNKTPALDLYDDLFVSERLTGELGLYATNKNELRAAVQLPQNELGRLRAVSVSPDFKWLAVSEKSRGAIWDLKKGERFLYVRGFRGAFIEGDTALLDFPKLDQTERQIAKVDIPKKDGSTFLDLGKDNRVRQYGPYLMTTKPAKKDGGYYEDVVVELQDVRTGYKLWTKNFPKESPRVFLDPRNDSLALSWRVTEKAAQEEIKKDAALKQKMGNKKEQEGDYYVQVIDPQTGNPRGRLLIETGKGSFRVASVFAVNDWVIVADTQNRVQVWSLSTGEKKGQVFGARSAVGKLTNLLCVENEPGQLTVYDLNTLQKRNQFTFTHPVALAAFSEDGKKLFALTANQSAYLLDVSSAEGAK